MIRYKTILNESSKREWIGSDYPDYQPDDECFDTAIEFLLNKGWFMLGNLIVAKGPYSTSYAQPMAWTDNDLERARL